MANLEFRNFPVTGGMSGTDIFLIQTDILGSKQYFQLTLSSLANIIGSQLNVSTTTPRLYIGSGSPEGVIQAVSGSLYTDWSAPIIYMKVSGTGVSGWM
jgi:hypothetical protein